MRLNQDYIVITDIGSTTTKALLLDNRVRPPALMGLAQTPTTVEAPLSDVRFGIKAAVQDLELQAGLNLLSPSADPAQLAWRDQVGYFSTSSAGGGLQILVIGLTLFDSASSAKRCAYGAGGVILDTFALDDNRQASEQMLAMRNLHPDMILLSGGTDGGAVSGVLRLAEILRIANPAPKFDRQGKIPALYAGNQDAAPIIRQLISDAFDLYLLPNLRPSLEAENLRPTQDKIQQLFMENVMEHAPGYAEVKPGVAAPIIPTPVGVQKTLELLSQQDQRNIFAFDIGGATTDVFSYVHGHFQRTVSANLGLSYSAWNVLRECGLDKLLRWLPADADPRRVRDYIANKCLSPTSNPGTAFEFRIEHALAREALSLALEQHRQMHYNGSKIGYLDKLKKGDLDKFELQFEYQREDAKHVFRESDIDVLIGAGGVFAYAQNPAQCLLMLIDSVRPKGITEIWIDRHFISPHLGVLSAVDPESAGSLAASECVERLGLHIAPAFPRKSKKAVMTLEVSSSEGNRLWDVMPDTCSWLPAGAKTLSLRLAASANLNTSLDLSRIETELPVIVDTRLDASAHLARLEQTLALYAPDAEAVRPAHQESLPALISGAWERQIELPYAGDINFEPGQKVQPDDVVAVNRFNPPRLYIVNGFSSHRNISAEQINRSLQVKVGDKLDFDQCYATLAPDVELPHYHRSARKLLSPVRGRIDYIDPNTGIMVLSEIQDYSGRPVKVHYADKLAIRPKNARRYLKRQLGDFVYQGELLAQRLERSADGAPPMLVKAPSTGTITEIDAGSGILTIAYQHQPLEFPAHVTGSVMSVTPGQNARIGYRGRRLEGRIAFGRECHGQLVFVAREEDLRTTDLQDKIAVLAFAPDRLQLETLSRTRLRGLICWCMDASELVAWLGFEPGVINTGNESLAFAILILAGFGQDAMPAALAAQLSAPLSCYLNPHTRIRAGVVRPFASF